MDYLVHIENIISMLEKMQTQIDNIIVPKENGFFDLKIVTFLIPAMIAWLGLYIKSLFDSKLLNKKSKIDALEFEKKDRLHKIENINNIINEILAYISINRIHSYIPQNRFGKKITPNDDILNKIKEFKDIIITQSSTLYLLGYDHIFNIIYIYVDLLNTGLTDDEQLKNFKWYISLLESSEYKEKLNTKIFDRDIFDFIKNDRGVHSYIILESFMKLYRTEIKIIYTELHKGNWDFSSKIKKYINKDDILKLNSKSN